MSLKTYAMQNNAILGLNLITDQIEFTPTYQRNSDVWDKEKRQLFIDSILNHFDIPKIYFHDISAQHRKLPNGKELKYAIIDGKQRMETILQFMADSFPLADDFVYYEEPKIKPLGLTYSEIAKKYPEIKTRFDCYTLPIIIVETDDTELIDEMFSRLNEAVALSSAEKRNALGGPIPKFINELAGHPFFTSKVNFSNKRYQHKETAAKLLFLEDTIYYQRRIIDTKRAFLDAFVKEYKRRQVRAQQKIVAKDPKILLDAVRDRLDRLDKVFLNKDPLLSQQGIVIIYYLLMRKADKCHNSEIITRDKLENFNLLVFNNKIVAEHEISEADFDYLEFDRLSMQGSNDANSIKERLRIISSFFGLE
ncbi:MAG: DUF262 domain-containing protein [Candidatus Bathyarchaeota archaeon]|nr:DUF262 domain-containing protein [Candidatus Bathyarchaeota archaeon]